MSRLAVPVAVAAACLVAVALGACAGQPDSDTRAGSRSPATPATPPSVKNVILFIGDGMQLAHEMAASSYLTGTPTGLSFQALPYQGTVATWDITTYNAYGSRRHPAMTFDPIRFDPTIGYDPRQGGTAPYPRQNTPSEPYLTTIIPPMERPPATDSASSATALATGQKTDDGNVAWRATDPEDGAMVTLPETLRQQRGMAVGVVSTVPFSHATPASFAAHNRHRNNYHEIADEILWRSRPEVVIGGGHPATLTEDEPDTYVGADTYRDLVAKSGSDYVLAERSPGRDGAATLNAAADAAVQGHQRLVGLFGGADGTLGPPVASDTPGFPAVRQSSVEDPTLRDSTLAALRVLQQDPDGFFLMAEQGDIDWANHHNDYARMVATVANLHQAVQATVDYIDRPGDDLSWDNTLLLVTADHANSGMRFPRGRPAGRGDLPTPLTTPCDDVCGYAPEAITYQSTEHTNELVSLYARGQGIDRLRALAGSWYRGTAILDNTQIHQVMAEVTGVTGVTGSPARPGIGGSADPAPTPRL